MYNNGLFYIVLNHSGLTIGALVQNQSHSELSLTHTNIEIIQVVDK